MKTLFLAMLLFHQGGDSDVDRKMTAVHSSMEVRRPQALVEFEENTKPLISIMRDDMQFFGYWDSAGEFIPAPGMSAYRAGHHFTTMEASALRPANRPFGLSSEKAYEFRSGMLIKGVLERDGNFIPDLHSKIIPLSEYPATNGYPRIYNLPGRFVKKNGRDDR